MAQTGKARIELSTHRDAAKDEWVLAVLGIDLSATPSDAAAFAKEPFRSRWTTLRDDWSEASYAADQQIGVLQIALRKSGNEDLAQIANFGMNALTGNFKVQLMAAMKDLDSANDDKVPKAAAKALPVIRGFRKHLSSDPRVKACDANPFGVSMSLAATLDGALGPMERLLSQTA